MKEQFAGDGISHPIDSKMTMALGQISNCKEVSSLLERDSTQLVKLLSKSLETITLENSHNHMTFADDKFAEWTGFMPKTIFLTWETDNVITHESFFLLERNYTKILVLLVFSPLTIGYKRYTWKSQDFWLPKVMPAYGPNEYMDLNSHILHMTTTLYQHPCDLSSTVRNNPPINSLILCFTL